VRMNFVAASLLLLSLATASSWGQLRSGTDIADGRVKATELESVALSLRLDNLPPDAVLRPGLAYEIALAKVNEAGRSPASLPSDGAAVDPKADRLLGLEHQLIVARAHLREAETTEERQAAQEVINKLAYQRLMLKSCPPPPPALTANATPTLLPETDPRINAKALASYRQNAVKKLKAEMKRLSELAARESNEEALSGLQKELAQAKDPGSRARLAGQIKALTASSSEHSAQWQKRLQRVTQDEAGIGALNDADLTTVMAEDLQSRDRRETALAERHRVELATAGDKPDPRAVDRLSGAASADDRAESDTPAGTAVR